MRQREVAEAGSGRRGHLHPGTRGCHRVSCCRGHPTGAREKKQRTLYQSTVKEASGSSRDHFREIKFSLTSWDQGLMVWVMYRNV